MYLASKLWKMKTRSQMVKTRINRILYNQTWHGDNKTKGKHLSSEEKERLGKCELCQGVDSQLHILNGCRHPTMMQVRECGRHQIIHRLQGATQCQRSRCTERVLKKDWSEPNPPAETWLGYWSDETAERVHDKLRGEKYTGNSSWILRDLTYYYKPICSTVYELYAVRIALLKHMSVQGALSGTVVSTFFDGIVVKAFPSKQPIPVTGHNGGRPNTVRVKRPLCRNSLVNCQGLPTLRVGNRQERKRLYFQYVTNKIPRSDAPPTTRYGKMTAGQLSNAIMEADVRTLNEYATHKQLEGYKDCYLAKSIHGTGICLKARQTLIIGENNEPRNRWKYQGDVQQIAKDEHVANVPLPHLIAIDEGDDSGDDDNSDTTSIIEDIQDCTGSRGPYGRTITWSRLLIGHGAPPGWRTKTLPLTPDATVKAVHEALEKVAQKIDPTSYVNRLTVSRSRHILASIISKHARRKAPIRHHTLRAP